MRKERYHIYFQKNDVDIMMLLREHKLAKVARTVIRAEAEGRHASLPLPPVPAKDVKPLKSMSLRLCEMEDGDIISWLSGVKHGYVSTVLKILIRRAMEKADLRAFMDVQESSSPEETPAEPVSAPTPKPTRKKAETIAKPEKPAMQKTQEKPAISVPGPVSRNLPQQTVKPAPAQPFDPGYANVECYAATENEKAERDTMFDLI